MGFSTSAAVAVVAIGALISLGLLYPAVEGSTLQISEASDDRQDRIIDARNSGVDIHSATYNDSADSLTVHVDNSGTVTLDVSKTHLLIDGELPAERTTWVEGDQNRDLWVGGEGLEIEVPNVETAPDRVVIATQTGVQDSTEDIEEET
ncbi:hypothetical protein [Natranaeroarchaeum sulfidigenes]|uniref:Archaellum protein F, flagellin of FlaG/FlaF family n=1 Tax=Natranaeroarchaeum sulfidigenes TaxID=2784880 RepID=A0A897MXF4_9EURY|nr:hypothetical protein [Natranaeroarchaeum sulfidigenes]QSG03599.1 Archaellum protein F, flagellin of FlaG/FlaF family [Natranaeroarchaeum sulfidigenes]